MEILRVPGEDLKCHFSYVISVGVAAVVTVSSSKILSSSRHREREGENLPLEDTNLFCCEECSVF
jgi:hypothetical protein